MKIKITQIIDFDAEKELKRLNHCFKGEQLKRQLDIYNTFIEGDFEKCIDLYNKLPYCKKDECPEQEFVGLVIGEALDKYNLNYIVEIVKDDKEINSFEDIFNEAEKSVGYWKELHSLTEDRLRRLQLDNGKMDNALRLIAAPIRPDGTWNRDRSACQKLAEETLKKIDLE